LSDPIQSVRAGTGPQTLVLLHGFGATHAVWNDLLPALSATMQIIAYDLPGHGRSLDAAGAGQAKTMAKAIFEDLAAAGLESIHVAGHSMGGAVAALMALVAPERVASLTLLAPGGIGESINGTLLRRYAAASDENELKTSLLAMSGPQALVPQATLRQALAMRARPGQMERLAGIVAMIARGERQGVIPRESLAALTMPVAVLWGEKDPVLPFAQTADLPQGFVVQAIAGAGHMLVEEAPDDVLLAITANVARATAIASGRNEEKPGQSRP
jgi:pyruvate dehydrogenase E2 component (dihydrolipoamide acetyltransferase)